MDKQPPAICHSQDRRRGAGSNKLRSDHPRAWTIEPHPEPQGILVQSTTIRLLFLKSYLPLSLPSPFFSLPNAQKSRPSRPPSHTEVLSLLRRWISRSNPALSSSWKRCVNPLSSAAWNIVKGCESNLCFVSSWVKVHMLPYVRSSFRFLRLGISFHAGASIQFFAAILISSFAGF